jgi:hypothetical protein
MARVPMPEMDVPTVAIPMTVTVHGPMMVMVVVMHVVMPVVVIRMMCAVSEKAVAETGMKEAMMATTESVRARIHLSEDDTENEYSHDGSKLFQNHNVSRACKNSARIIGFRHAKFERPGRQTCGIVKQKRHAWT